MVADGGELRQLFVSKAGHIGWVPEDTQPGDIVCVFLGAGIPHVLRKRASGEGYTFIGDAFVYGGMDGELMLNREHVTFEVC